ncbi:MAG TPA: threonine synthase [Steroidobacteraceae bacterium]|nr:threonine synthase [Steroidobacteraceae bacterium]
MLYQSTRDATHPVGLGVAIAQGLAPDGGLYVPVALPRLELGAFDGAEDIRAAARVLLQPFAAGDVSSALLPDIVDDAFDFAVPLVEVSGAPGPLAVLELFHGPTAAFKDFGARFLAATLERIPRTDPRRLTILVATSGDTGGAVAAAFHRRPWVDVVVLYPEGLVSPRQEKQLACWGDNVRTLAVAGSFDDCQRMVKDAFVDPALGRELRLSSANSINVGRLLPQMAYYAVSSLQLHRRDGRKPNYIVPSGNLGNVAACLWARQVGLPIGEVVLATNANLTVPEYLRTGEWQPRPSLATLASAMDVGNPSNMERLRWLFGGADGLRAQFSAYPVSDDDIRATIRRDFRELGQTWCPHTATAAHVYRNLPADRREERWVLVATAHPAKFNDIVEPLIGREVPVPPALADLLALPSLQRRTAPTLEALRTVLMGKAA